MRAFNVDGVLVGRPNQTVHEQSATQKYPIGTIYEPFGKRWRYCLAAEDITIARRGCPALIYNPWKAGAPQFGADGTTVTGNAGEPWVIATFGADYDVAKAVDVLQGGLLTLYLAAPRDDEIFEYTILGNDASYEATLADDRCKIYIDPPLSEDMTAVAADGIPSPYSAVGASGSGTTTRSFVVVPEIQVTTGYYFWGQTRGPAWVTPSAGWQTANYRDCCFHTNGTIIPHLDSTGVAKQRCGYLLADCVDADDAHIMLMLE